MPLPEKKRFLKLLPVMTKPTTAKKHLVTSYRNLAPELQEEVKSKYPAGFTDAMIRVDKCISK